MTWVTTPKRPVAAPQRVEVGISLFELLDFPIRFHQAHADYVVADLAGFIGKGRILGRPRGGCAHRQRAKFSVDAKLGLSPSVRAPR